MKLLIQRVTRASVDIGGQSVANIKSGLLVLVGFGQEDTSSKLPRAVDKLVNLRIFPDAQGRFQYSVLDEHKSLLAVPQFTLYGKTDSGRRPDFTSALDPSDASQLFDIFCGLLGHQPLDNVEFGIFGADMQVSLVNDGPVTIIIEV